MIRTIQYLKDLFITGYKPKQADYTDVFDTMDAAQDAVEITWMAFMNLYGTDTMRPGVYKIKDSEAADAGVYVKALDKSRIALNATGLFLNCDFQNLGGNVIGGWWSGITVSAGEVCIWNGLHYKSLTGAAGTAPHSDPMDWKKISKPDASYISEADYLEYDVVNDKPLFRADKRCNKIYDVPDFQWGNDACCGNIQSPGCGMVIINQRGICSFNNITEAPVLMLDETHRGNISCNEFSGLGGYSLNLDYGKIMIGSYVSLKYDASFYPSQDYDRVRIENLFSDSVQNNSISGSTFIDLGVFNQPVGIVNASSANATESVNDIKNLPEGRVIRIYPQVGLTVTFATGGGIVMKNGTSMVINGSHHSWIEFQNIGGTVYHTNDGKY